MSTVQREDAHTEERIAQILNEAQQAMQIKKAMEQVRFVVWSVVCLHLHNIPSRNI